MRYLDPDHERALASAAQVRAARQALEQADRGRRRALACRNTYRTGLRPHREPVTGCECVYCDPEEHYRPVRLSADRGHNPFVVYRCLCGGPVPAAGQRCGRHRDTAVVVLDGDGSALALLAQAADQEPRA